MILALLIAAAAPSSTDAISQSTADACKSKSSADIVVCGKPSDRYRIDPAVLQASREHDAPPPKPSLEADANPSNACVGLNSCTGGVIPLVGMALVAAKAAELAATGGDWRDALRTHEDEYRLYKEAEERKASERRVRIGISAGH